MEEKIKQLKRDIEKTDRNISSSEKRIKLSDEPSSTLGSEDSDKASANACSIMSDSDSVGPHGPEAIDDNKKETKEKRSKTYEILSWSIEDKQGCRATLAIDINKENKAICFSLTDRKSKTTETFTVEKLIYGDNRNCILETKDGARCSLHFAIDGESNKFYDDVKGKKNKPIYGSLETDIAQAFDGPFKENEFSEQFKDYALSLINNISKSFYFSIGFIIQSSGHGKSKTMQWYAKSNICIYVCLRGEEANGFPERSMIAGDFIAAMAEIETAKDFLIGLLESAIHVMNMIKKNISTSDWRIIRKVAEEFYQYQPWGTCTKEETLKKTAEFKERVTNCSTSNPKELEKNYKEAFGKKPLYIFLDEATSLLVETNVRDKKEFLNAFRVMRRGMNSIYSRLPIAVILASTSGKMYDFVPHINSLTGSERTVQDLKLKPSFYKILYTDMFIPDEEINAFELEKTHQFLQKRDPQTGLFCYGRPLWNCVKTSGDLVVLAKLKLICANDWSSLKPNDKIFASLAVLSVRTSLSDNYSNYLYGKEMVTRYMCTLYHIDTEQQNYHTCYITEPILAEAAASVMSEKTPLLEILNAFNSYMQSGSLNTVGPLGEIVAELILLLGFDNAFVKKGKNFQFFSKPITVKEFLESLVGSRAKIILKSLTPEFKKGYVYFTQFVKKLENLTFKSVWSGFLARCAAIQLKDNPKDIDLVIPVLLENAEIAYITIQVKNHAKPTKKFLESAAKKSQPLMDFYKGSDKKEKRKSFLQNDYLGLVMSVGAENNPTVEEVKRSQKEPKNESNFILHGLGAYPFLEEREIVQPLKSLIECGRQNSDTMVNIYEKALLKSVKVPSLTLD